MKTFLLTGFEPFDGEKINPSWEAVRQLDGWVCDDHTVLARRMPCVFSTVSAALRAAISETRPEMVLCIGQAGTRCDISVERIAININDARIPDNAGYKPIDLPVAADGPAAYFSTLPIKAIVANIREAGLPATVSQTAGTYICNHIFYTACHLRATAFAHVRKAGFIHIPLSPEQAARKPGRASASTADVVRALRIAIATSIRQERDILASGGTVD